MLPSSSFADDQLLDISLGCRSPSEGGWATRHDDTMIVTMRHVKADRSNTMPLHDQVAAEIRRDIANGDVRPGQRLPPPATWQPFWACTPTQCCVRLRILREEGVLEFCRGRGVTVSGEPERGVIWAQAQDLLAQARRFGLQREDVVSIIESLS